MKVRMDFVTNSSSSSFICVAKVDKSNELIEYMKEEYGKYGLRLLDKYLTTGKEVKNDDNKYEYEPFVDYCEDNNIEIPDDNIYLCAEFIEYTNEGDTEDDDIWLYNHIPDKYKEEIYNSGE